MQPLLGVLLLVGVTLSQSFGPEEALRKLDLPPLSPDCQELVGDCQLTDNVCLKARGKELKRSKNVDKKEMIARISACFEKFQEDIMKATSGLLKGPGGGGQDVELPPALQKTLGLIPIPEGPGDMPPGMKLKPEMGKKQRKSGGKGKGRKMKKGMKPGGDGELVGAKDGDMMGTSETKPSRAQRKQMKIEALKKGKEAKAARKLAKAQRKAEKKKAKEEAKRQKMERKMSGGTKEMKRQHKKGQKGARKEGRRHKGMKPAKPMGEKPMEEEMEKPAEMV